jgi:hypothetical protein
MIYAYTGKTGSGKTFSMVKDARKYWLAGTDVYSNTLLYFDKHGDMAGTNIETSPELYGYGEHIYNKIKKTWAKIWKREYKPVGRGAIKYFEDINEIMEAKNAVILFDEAQVLFNARMWESLSMEFQHKLQQHRKHKLDLLCTTQNLGTIDIAYRRLVQGWFRRSKKDIDKLYNNVDDLMVENVSSQFFMIGFWTKRLYDTYFDIGFTKLKIIWLREFKKGKVVQKVYMIEKEKTLKSVLTAESTLNRALKLVK